MQQIALYRRMHNSDINVHNIHLSSRDTETVKIYNLDNEAMKLMIAECLKSRCKCAMVVSIYREYKTPENLLKFVKDAIADGDCEDLLAKLTAIKAARTVAA